MYKIRILILCIGLMFTACASFDAEDKEFTSFVINLIENQENYEKIIMNSKYVLPGDSISKFYSVKNWKEMFNLCKMDGYKILPIRRVIITRSNNSKINGLYVIAISKKITVSFQFLEESKWVLTNISQIGCGEQDKDNIDSMIEE